MKNLLRAYGNLKIRQKILLCNTVLMLIMCLVIGLFYGAVVHRTVLRRWDVTNTQNLQLLSDGLAAINRKITVRLNHLSKSISVRERLRASQTWNDRNWGLSGLLADMKSSNEIQEVGIYSVARDFLSGTDADWAYNGPLPQEVARRVLASPQECLWRDEETGTTVRSEQLFCYQPILDGAEPVGIVRVKVNLAALAELYSYLSFSGFSDLYIFSQQGKMLLPKTTAPAALTIGRKSYQSYFKDGSAQSGTGTYTYQGQRYRVRSAAMDPYDIYAVCIISHEHLDEDVHALQMVIILLGLFCLLTQSLFYLFFGNMLARPIVCLSAKMEKVGASDESLLVPLTDLPSGRDEIGTLGQSCGRMLERIRTLMEENSASEKRKHELELGALQTQITPHFLYNTLDNVSALAQMGDSRGAYEMATALGGFYRGVLSDGRSVIRLDEALRMIDNYLKVQSLRFRDAFRYEINLPADLADVCTVKLTIQPLVENAVYHGIRGLRRGGMIRISARHERGMVIISVWDNGRGIPVGTRENENSAGKVSLRRKGYGMINSEKRLKLYFGDQSRLQVTSVEGEWTRVEMWFPLRRYTELQ